MKGFELLMLIPFIHFIKRASNLDFCNIHRVEWNKVFHYLHLITSTWVRQYFEFIWHKRGEIMTYKKREMSAKERIYEAVIRLISEDKKPYDQISVQDIVDEAGVCRNSFYRNFKTKSDIFMERFMEISKYTGVLMQGYEGDFAKRIFRSFFESAKEHREFLLAFYKAVPNMYFDTFTGVIKASNMNGREDLSPEDYYKYSCRAWISVGILTEWMKKGCQTPVDDMIEWFEKWSIGLMKH